MKVLHVVPSVSPRRGGPSTTVVGLTDALQRLGCDVTIATTDDDLDGRLPVEGMRKMSNEGVRYRYFKRNSHFYSISTGLRHWLRANSSSFDLIHIHALFNFPSLIAANAANKSCVPYIVRPLGTLQLWGMTQRRPLLKGISWRLIERRIIARAAAVQFSTELEQREAARLGIESTATIIIPNPVPRPPHQPERHLFRRQLGLAEDPLILFLSRVDEKKGLDLLIRAFALVQSETDARLVIAGDGPEALKRSLSSLASELGVSTRIVWTGHLDDHDKWSAFSAADVFALTSHAENFGIAVVEAMSCGLPVLITDGVGLHEAVVAGAAGVSVPPTVSDIASGLLSMLANRSRLSDMGHAARALARTFEPDTIAAQTYDLYRTLTAKPER